MGKLRLLNCVCLRTGLGRTAVESIRAARLVWTLELYCQESDSCSFHQADLTEEERDRNMNMFAEVMRAEFPEEEMADRTFRDKVREYIIWRDCWPSLQRQGQWVHYMGRWLTEPLGTRSEIMRSTLNGEMADGTFRDKVSEYTEYVVTRDRWVPECVQLHN